MKGKEIITQVMKHKALSMKHDLITHTYINFGLEMTKNECLNDLWNYYESNQDKLQMYCTLCDFDLTTVNEIYQVLYNGFCESKIIINNYYKKGAPNNEG